MIFHITRTSGSWDGKPCEEAFPGIYKRWDKRTFKSPEEYNEKLGGSVGKLDWHEQGFDHRAWEYEGKPAIKRAFMREGYLIDIKSLEELLSLSEKYGELVFSYEDVPSIEIYDDYRE